ncbi:hypothetical protein D3C80_895430 [compost metagenome]
MVIGLDAFLEGHQVLVVQAVGALAADDRGVALVELDADHARDLLLALVDGGLQHLALGREPEAVVDEVGVFDRQFVLQVHGAAVQGDGLDAAVGGQQDRAAGGLIDAARLHADEAVLDQVQTTDAVVVAVLVQRGQQGRRRHGFAVDRDGVALFKADGDDGGDVRGGFRRDGALVHELGGLDGGVFQNLALGRGVQKVGVDREGGLAALVLGDRDLVLLGEVQQGLARTELPLAPGGDDVDVGVQGVVAQLEADLVVALAGGAVTDGVGAQLAGDLDLALGDQRTRDRGAEQILAFIEGVGAEHREDEVAHELFAQVVDEDVLGLDAQLQRLLLGWGQFFALAQVGGEGDDLRTVFLLQPLQDDRRVQPARIGEDDFLGGGRGHGSKNPFGTRGGVSGALKGPDAPRCKGMIVS